MTSSLTSTPPQFAGPTAPISDDNVFNFCFSNPFQHTPNNYVSKTAGKSPPEHTFDGLIIPPQRPCIIHAGTGATLSWQRARADSLRVARYFHAIAGNELPWDGKQNLTPIHAPRTTILLHLPNCLAFPLLLLGGAACLYTVTPISTMLMPNELANILAKARPQILVTTVGADGEDKLRNGLQILLDRPDTDVASVSGKEVKRWARELAASWDRGRKQKSQKGEKMPIKEQRVWTVNLASSGGADYYGSSTRGDGISTLADPRDWSNLLTPPLGHKHAGSPDSLTREAFVVRKLTKEEQARRVFLLLWSSGTTGESKGVLLSHRNLVTSVGCHWHSVPLTYGTSRGPFGGGETWIALAPWCHIMGMTTLLLPTFAMGATMVLPASPKFDLASYLRLVTKYRATKLHIAPPVAIALRNTPLLDRTTTEGKEIDLSSVKVMLSGGAPTPTEVVKTIYNRTGIPLQLGYGATETGSVSQCEAHDFMNPLSLKELGSAGFAMSNNEVCIRPMEETTEEQTKTRFLEAVEQGKQKIKAGECAAEEPSLPGEVCIRGPHIMLGYYSGLASDEGIGAKDEKLSSTAFTSDGYYRTGDEGVFDKEGRLWLIGRTKELIKVKGFQVPPVELDNLFAKHPETLDAAAAGIVEGDGGEQVVMYVVPKDQNVLTNLEHQVDLVNRLSHYVTDKLAHYKWPKYYVFSPTVLKNPTGKVMRKELCTLPGTRHLAPRQDRQSKM